MRIDVAAGVPPVLRLEPIGGGREGVADLVVAQRDADIAASSGVPPASMKSSGQIQSNGPIDTGPATTAAA